MLQSVGKFLITQDKVPFWTWSRLVYEIGFDGCELLIIDAEGFDVDILNLEWLECWTLWLTDWHLKCLHLKKDDKFMKVHRRDLPSKAG